MIEPTLGEWLAGSFSVWQFVDDHVEAAFVDPLRGPHQLKLYSGSATGAAGKILSGKESNVVGKTMLRVDDLINAALGDSQPRRIPHYLQLRTFLRRRVSTVSWLAGHNAGNGC